MFFQVDKLAFPTYIGNIRIVSSFSGRAKYNEIGQEKPTNCQTEAPDVPHNLF